MSDSETYDEDLIAAGNFEEKTMDDIKVHISGDPDLSRSQGIANIDISSIINSNNSSPNQFLLSILLSITAIMLITISIFSNSWMTGVESDDHYGIEFGLTGFYAYEVGVEGDSAGGSYSDSSEWGFDEENAGSRAYFAGLAGLIFLILGIISAAFTLYLFVMESIGLQSFSHLSRLRFSSGGLVIVGCTVWLILFPTTHMVELTDINFDLGTGFYLALLGGVAGALSGVMQFGSESSSSANKNSEDEIMMKSDIIDCVKRLSLKSINRTTGILTLTIFSIVVIFISMFTNLWMIGTWEGEEGEYQYGYFGLHEESSEFDGDTYILDYSFDDCKESQLCSDLGKAGFSSFVALLISISILVAAMVFIHLDSIGLFKSNYGKIAAILGGVMSILATLVFYTKFPDLSDVNTITSPGISLFLVGFSGIVAIVSGLMVPKSEGH